MLKQVPPNAWSSNDALELYAINRWGHGHFTINDEGHLALVHGNQSIDLKHLVDSAEQRGIQLPLLLRFSHLIEARLQQINQAFQEAIDAYGYEAGYRGVYPIKVNQARRVVESVTRAGRPFHFGLEAGSKAELVAVMAMLDDPEALVICNGYKDETYIETALLASRLGPKVILVIEKPIELERIYAVSQRIGIRPVIGMRARLASRGSGKWESSGGDRAKFGLTVDEALTAVHKMKEWGMLGCFELLHFHLGSQITAIRAIKDALCEASRTYVGLIKLGCENLNFFDVGGGLGVDYDGSKSNVDSSMNYTVQEYANDVVSAVQDICDSEGVPHPTLVSESGRALVAHHSVLVLNVVGVSAQAIPESPQPPDEDAHNLVQSLWEVYSSVNPKNVRECYHDALALKDQVLQAFNLGSLSLPERAKCERLFWASCARILAIRQELSRVPDELQRLDSLMSDTYFCNFSVFQSLPDAWAIGQLFPITPLHRLNEKPSRRGILADITCDSDGVLKSFIADRHAKKTLELHPVSPGESYFIGVMLTGAYQEILGDLHNLFGDTNVMHIRLDDSGEVELEDVLAGDTVGDVLRYVNYTSEDLLSRLRKNIEKAVRRNTLSLEQAKGLVRFYRESLSAYTYLE